MDFEKFCESKNKESIEKGKVYAEQNNLNYNDLLNKYSGKTKSELFNELVNIVRKQKANDSLSNEQLINIYNSVAPMLSGEEQANLKSLIETIKNV